jgi:hypothetical protein
MGASPPLPVPPLLPVSLPAPLPVAAPGGLLLQASSTALNPTTPKTHTLERTQSSSGSHDVAGRRKHVSSFQASMQISTFNSRGIAPEFLVAAPDTSTWCCTDAPHGTSPRGAPHGARYARQAAGSSATRNGLRCLTRELNVTCREISLRSRTRAGKSGLLARVLRVALCSALASACRSHPAPPKRQSPDAGRNERSSETRAGAGLELRGERTARDPSWFIIPPEQPWQVLALSGTRLGVLEGAVLVVRSLPDLRVLSRIRVPGARNVVAAADGAFLVADNEHVYRLAETEVRAEIEPRLPRLGPTSMLPHPERGDLFWARYEGVPELFEFSLGSPAAFGNAALVASIQLRGFDGRALLGLGDGSFLYSSAGGLERRYEDARIEHLALPELSGEIWGLGPGTGFDQVWAVTSRHIYALVVRAPLVVRQRWELPLHSVALASRGGKAFVLAVDRVEKTRFQLRIESYALGAEQRSGQRFEVDVMARDAGPGAGFLPQLALSPGGEWLAVNAFGPELFDWRSKRRLFP